MSDQPNILDGPNGYATVQDEGVAVTKRSVLNFTGAGVTASDSGGKTAVDIPGGSGPVDGWTAAGETWTYVSADGPTGVFSVNADVTAKYAAGMRVKLTQTTVKYGIVTAVGAFSAGATPVTIYMGTDYTLANAAITSPYWSMLKAPFGFPLDPAKWTVEVTDTSDRTQATPTGGTWYNPGSLTISIPIGCWRVMYECVGQSNRAGVTATTLRTGLSTANNTAPDAQLSSYQEQLSASATQEQAATIHRERTLTVAAKTSYFLVAMTPSTSASLTILGTLATTAIRAVCAYL